MAWLINIKCINKHYAASLEKVERIYFAIVYSRLTSCGSSSYILTRIFILYILIHKLSAVNGTRLILVVDLC